MTAKERKYEVVVSARSNVINYHVEIARFFSFPSRPIPFSRQPLERDRRVLPSRLMYNLIRRISNSVIPRPDRPWEEDGKYGLLSQPSFLT